MNKWQKGGVAVAGVSVVVVLFLNELDVFEPQGPLPQDPSQSVEIELEAKPEAVEAFSRTLDAKVIAKVEQYSNSALLYLTVTDAWTELTGIKQKELAIATRDQWEADCECFAPVLVFRSQGGVELIKISAGQPEVIK